MGFRSRSKERIDCRPMPIFLRAVAEPHSPILNQYMVIRWSDIYLSRFNGLSILCMLRRQLRCPAQNFGHPTTCVWCNVKNDKKCRANAWFEVFKKFRQCFDSPSRGANNHDVPEYLTIPLFHPTNPSAHTLTPYAH